MILARCREQPFPGITGQLLIRRGVGFIMTKAVLSVDQHGGISFGFGLLHLWGEVLDIQADPSIGTGVRVRGMNGPAGMQENNSR